MERTSAQRVVAIGAGAEERIDVDAEAFVALPMLFQLSGVTGGDRDPVAIEDGAAGDGASDLQQTRVVG